VPPPGPVVRYARYGAVAFEFSGTIAAGCVIGWLLDRWFGTEPYLLVVSTLAAVIGGFIRLIAILRRFDRLDVADGEP
jgi:F0F1-type ATP synthase assembly protein I